MNPATQTYDTVYLLQKQRPLSSVQLLVCEHCRCDSSMCVWLHTCVLFNIKVILLENVTVTTPHPDSKYSDQFLF